MILMSTMAARFNMNGAFIVAGFAQRCVVGCSIHQHDHACSASNVMIMIMPLCIAMLLDAVERCQWISLCRTLDLHEVRMYIVGKLDASSCLFVRPAPL